MTSQVRRVHSHVHVGVLIIMTSQIRRVQSCTCRSIDFAAVSVMFSIRFWNYSDSVAFFFYFIISIVKMMNVLIYKKNFFFHFQETVC
jgi:hypothetical protein